MAQQTVYTPKQMHELFRQFLMRKFEDDVTETDVIIKKAEEELLFILNEHFGTGYGTIYDLQDEGKIDELLNKIISNPVLKNIDISEEPRYTVVLKWYKRFVKSLHKDTTPLLVPGEEDTHPSMTADNPEPPVKHNDADYAPDSEGMEHQYNLTKKERNPELRRKCIEYYKNQWNEHIHCICCGFDFGKAYGDIGEGYIEIHHVPPHSSIVGEHEVDPTRDLIPLCSNCHSMIHRVEGRGTCMTLEELKEHYKGINYND